MPEYLAPGVYVEEVSFRSIIHRGRAHRTTGFAGMTRSGPVRYAEGPSSCEPRLVTSFTEFERIYGGLTPLSSTPDGDGASDSDLAAYLATRRAPFFDNGGKAPVRVARVRAARGDTRLGVAQRVVTRRPQAIRPTWHARAGPAADGRYEYARDPAGAQQERAFAMTPTRVPSRPARSHRTVGGRLLHAAAGPSHRLRRRCLPFLGNAPTEPGHDLLGRSTTTRPADFWPRPITTESPGRRRTVIQIVEMQAIVKVDAENVYVFAASIAARPGPEARHRAHPAAQRSEDENAPCGCSGTDAVRRGRGAHLMKALHDNPGRLAAATTGSS